ncbi:hypothetical protein OBCHQ24_03635 [Oceanobacillus iheyensis]|nr:hypothetical protein OBCHQ24_03635 [Oceanobacillus iheyensis]
MVQFTWYVNFRGDVQIYEGNINETLINDVYTVDEAMKDQSIKHEHRKPVYKKRYSGLKGLFNNEKNIIWDIDKVTIEKRPPIKYWIPEEHAETFFFCIGELLQRPGSSGLTEVDISEFLD